MPLRVMLRRPKHHARRPRSLAEAARPRPLSFAQSLARVLRESPREETRVTDRTSPVSGVAERYAAALFDLSREGDGIEAVEADLSTLWRLLDEASDFRRLVESPAFSAEDQERAVAAIAARAELGGLVANFIQLLARNRRLFVLSGIIRSFRDMAARERGEVTAEVTSAHPLDDSDIEALKAVLRDRLGKDVAIETRVNKALLGGIVVKVGSRMIDTSLRTKLMTLKTRLKEVG
jgi:F-type H+-transporting ATPase subunit delta